MKNYNNYHKVDTKSEIINNGNLLFDITLANSLEKQFAIINDIEREMIVQAKTGDYNGDKRYILTKPSVTKAGDYIHFGEDIYLVTSNLLKSDVYDKFLIQLCNTSMAVKGEKVPIKWDQLGNVIEWSDGEEVVLPCIADKSLVYGDGKYNSPVNLPDNKIKVIIPYQELKVNRFSLYNEEYKVRDLDLTQTYKRIGIITITGERSVEGDE